MTMPSGITNALTTNIGTVLVLKLVPLIRFKSYNKQLIATVLSIFIISYTNMGLLLLRQYKHQSWIPGRFRIAWLLFWGKAISLSLLVSNLMPYLGPSLKLLIKRGCCCCKRKDFKPRRYLNPEFAMERRYAMVMNLMFMVFTFAFALPALPLIGCIVLTI